MGEDAAAGPPGPDDGLSGAATTPIDEQQRAALAQAADWVGGEVHAVGLGSTDDGRPCVVVHAGLHAPDLPREVNGLPVQVVTSGPIQAQDAGDPPPG